MSYYGFPEYVSVAEKRKKAEKSLAKLKKKYPDISPVMIEGRTIAKTWWGKAWNTNLEKYADFSNRIARGKSYVRNGAVLDLKIEPNKVKALVQGSGSKPYQVDINISPISPAKMNEIIQICNHKIDTMEELLEGKFPKELEILFTKPGSGLFPSPKEIQFTCSCPDIASVCKHVAAVLYGIGARFDKESYLFFKLRNLDIDDLIKKSMDKKMNEMLKNAGSKSKRAIDESDVSDLFGL